MAECARHFLWPQGNNKSEIQMNVVFVENLWNMLRTWRPHSWPRDNGGTGEASGRLVFDWWLWARHQKSGSSQQDCKLFNWLNTNHFGGKFLTCFKYNLRAHRRMGRRRTADGIRSSSWWLRPCYASFPIPIPIPMSTPFPLPVPSSNWPLELCDLHCRRNKSSKNENLTKNKAINQGK